MTTQASTLATRRTRASMTSRDFVVVCVLSLMGLTFALLLASGFGAELAEALASAG